MVDVAPSKGLVQPNQEITFRASTEGFDVSDSGLSSMHFNWCLDKVPLNTLVAGSSDKIVPTPAGTESLGPYSLRNDYGTIQGPFMICNYDDYIYPVFPIERPNNVWELSINNSIVPREYDLRRQFGSELDTDNDGMNDEWEMRFFGGRSIVQEGEETEDGEPTVVNYPLEPRAELLALVTPDGDPDFDGWIYNYTDAHYEDDDDDRHPSSGGNYDNPDALRIPRIGRDGAGNENGIGDGSWTNYEEFVAGTDPLNPDTDGDGISDGLDWAGNQQDIIPVDVEKDWGDKYSVHVNAFGITQSYKDGETNKDNKYYRVMYPNYNPLGGNETITTEGDNIISVGTGLAFETAMGYSPAPALAGDDSVTITAETTKIGETRGLDLHFKWFVDGEEYVTENDEGGQDSEAGFGKKSMQFNPSRGPCEYHTVGLEVTETKTRKISYNEMEIRMGFPIEFNKRILGNADSNKEGYYDFNERVGTEQSWQDLRLDAEDPLLSQVNPDVGYRKGDIVELTVNNITDPTTIQCGDEGDTFEDYLNGISYSWNYTRKQQETKSGLGPGYKSAIFIVEEDPRTEEGANGQRAGTLLEQSNEYAAIEVSDKSGAVIGRLNEDMVAIAPTINFEISGAEQGTSEENGETVFRAEPGADVTVTADLSYFRPSVGFEYVWKRNNVIVGELRNSLDTSSSYTFQAGIGLDGQPVDISDEMITLEVVNTISSPGDDDRVQSISESSDQAATIELITESPGGVDVISGALKGFLPSYYRNVFNLAMAAAATCLVVILALGFTGGTQTGKRE